ncbi:chitin-binding domain protein cbd-1-like isoform X1 [Physella acuta]|uniref:chitin-binding domain protein cbd-1-like isoform X1 n=1 Tax=Physella acuta TaxID=109671 RepID=UPI0027DE1E6F|nr:chitin-binding domain protein cbd-1-like isoform X1 [Physella acuta]
MAAHIVFFIVCLQVLLVQGGDDSTICKDSGWTSGAHPYPYDCQHYVLCNGTLTIVRACNDGTFYDAAVRACLADNHGRPCLANQDLSTPPSYLDTTVCRQYGWASGIHPYPGDCNHYVYCVNSNTHIVVCPPGTSFDTRVNGCLDKSDAEPCQATTTTPAPITTEANTDANICSHNGWVFGIHPYPTDCNHYVYCVNSNTHIVVCPPGTSFDTRVNGCLDTSDAEPCKATTTPAPTTTNANTDANICSHNGWAAGIHPYPGDCNHYVYCVNYNTHILVCPPGTSFDTRVNGCLDTSDAEPCKATTTPAPTTTTTPARNTTITITDSNICSHNGWVFGTHPYPTDCSRYVICINSVTHVVICAPGTRFDKRVKDCLVTSYAEPCYTNDQWTDMAGICNKFNLVDGIYPDPGACSKFVECVSANTYHMECPASLMFNSKLLVCDEAYDVVCTDNYNYNFQNIIIG